MPRFVLLLHDVPGAGIHYDLMLERGGALATWRLATLPGPGGSVPAERLGDHRIAYLDREGAIGGGRGTVAHWDRGDYVASRWEEGLVEVDLSGGRTSGRCRIEQGPGGQWTITRSA